MDEAINAIEVRLLELNAEFIRVMKVHRDRVVAKNELDAIEVIKWKMIECEKALEILRLYKQLDL